jgi:hypothetical protein
MHVTGFCGDLPMSGMKALGCKCVNVAGGLTLSCDQEIKSTLAGIDTTVSVIYSLKPCEGQATVEFRNTDPKVDYSYGVKAGVKEQIPIPDLSYKVPGAGTGK